MKFSSPTRWHRLAGAMAFLLVLALTVPGLARAQNSTPAATLTNITQFSSIIGLNPSGAPIQAADGSFYGTTQNGGANGYGAIYRRATDGTITVLYSFGNYDATANQPLDGSNPNTALIAGAAAGTFYGTTPNGGTNGYGTVYRVVTDGTAAGTTFTVLHAFVYQTDGASPQASLLRALDGNLYGTTPYGGPVGNGTIFSLSTDGTNFTDLYNFDANAVGYNSQSPLIEGPAGTFYGTARYDGPNGLGSLFKFTAANGVATAPVVLHAFNNYANGGQPEGNLVLDNGVIYGTTYYGGPQNYYGSIYAVSTDGTTRVNTPLYGFTYTNSNGYRPLGGLTLVGGALYGTTQFGGVNDAGTVFSAAEDGSALTVLHTFTFTDGTYSQTPLTPGIDGTSLYGTSPSGGTSNDGTLFQLSLDGSTFTVLNNFFVDYQDPEAALVQGADGAFYGTTQYGGVFNDGRIFRVDASGAITTLHEFSGTVGSTAIIDSLNQSSTTAAAKSTRKSQAKANRSRTLHTAAAQPNVATPTTSDGANPIAALIQGPGGVFYGTTQNGGDNNNGAIFSISADGQTYTIIHSFAAYNEDTTNADGSNPVGALLLGTDGLIYGVTNNGGTSSYGTIYRFAADGTGFAIVHQLAGGATDVAYPNSGLILGPDGTFYGATQGGGPNENGDGGVYSLSADGATLTVLHFFTGTTTEGRYAYAPPVFGADGFLYGTTYRGGNFNDGTVYKVSPDGTTFTTLYNFSNVDGNSPESSLLASADGYLYGTTRSGGVYGQGVIYRLSTAGDLSVIYSFSLNGGIEDDVITNTTSANTTPSAVAPLPSVSDRANGSAANLIQGADGFFYGTSPSGGVSGDGSVYRVSVTPVITSASGAVATVGTAFSFAVAAEHPPATFAASGLPGGLTINPATGLITGTPTTTGTYPVILTATNDAGTATQTLTIVVQPAPVPSPTVTSTAPPSGTVNVAYSYQITASGTPTSFGATGLPPGLTIDPATGLVSGTPTAAGTFPVTFLATNSGGTSSASFSLTIAPAVVPPVISGTASASGQVGQPFTYQVAASNTPTSYGATGLPDGLTINATTGLISGTPTAAGPFTVGLSSTNASGTGTATLNLTITAAVLQVPVISSETSASGQVALAFTYQIAASNSPIVYGATGLPGGLVINDRTGVISGTPTAAGPFTVTVMATNSTGSGTATLTLTIAPQPLPVISIIASIPNVTIGTGQLATFAVTRTGGDSTQTLAVNYSVGGKAIAGTDYLALKGVKTFKPGKTTVRINVTPEGTLGGVAKKGIKITLLPGEGYTLGTSTVAHVHILAPVTQ